MRIGDSLFMESGKDGGPKSLVTGFWLVRIKWLFTIAVLRFDRGTREAYHSHAFNSWSWLLSGGLLEQLLHGGANAHKPSWRPIRTDRETFHKVHGIGDANWVLTIRGPWQKTWMEVDEAGDTVLLTHDRVELERGSGPH